MLGQEITLVALIVGRADEERVCELGDELLGVKLRSGEHLLMDGRSGLLVERIPRPEVEELVLEEVPDITYADVGGLDPPWRAFELPAGKFRHRVEHKHGCCR